MQTVAYMMVTFQSTLHTKLSHDFRKHEMLHTNHMNHFKHVRKKITPSPGRLKVCKL